MIIFEYATVSEAINELVKSGYTVDFNLTENVNKFESGEYSPGDFEITGVYRYEGDSDPGDEAVVYAIESKAGVKGILVSGFGSSSNRSADIILNLLKHQQH